MAETITAPEYLTNLFQNGVYHIDVNGKPYESGTVYDVDDVYTVTLNDGVAGKLPLALLFASMQIGLAEVASCKAESYMNKIVNNQEIQIACSSNINEANKLKETASANLEKYLEDHTLFQDYDSFNVDYIRFSLRDADGDFLSATAEDKKVEQAMFSKLQSAIEEYNSDDEIVAIALDNFWSQCTKTVVTEPTLPKISWTQEEGKDPVFYYAENEEAGEECPKSLSATTTYAYAADAVTLIFVTESGVAYKAEYNLSATESMESTYTLKAFTENGQKIWKWIEDEKTQRFEITESGCTFVRDGKSSVFPILSDEFVANCVTAGIYEVDGVYLCEMKDGKPLLVKVDENGEPILVKTDANGKPILATVNDDGKYVDDNGVLINESDVYIDATGIYILDENGAYIEDEKGKPISKNVGLSGEQLDELITDLGVIQDKATTTTQTDMVYAEDYLGQYNSYLNGGSSNIDDLTNSLQTIAQRI